MKKKQKRFFEELPFYNILIEKPKLKDLKSIDVLHKLPFYDELSIKQISEAFRRYSRSYKIEIVDSKDPLAQLEQVNQVLNIFFQDLLDEMKGFKHQITVKVL